MQHPVEAGHLGPYCVSVIEMWHECLFMLAEEAAILSDILP